MPAFVLMPQKGLSEESAILTRWYVKSGDTIKPGQYLFAIETSKAVFDVEAEVSGVVLETIGEEGDEILIKTPMCVIGDPGEEYSLPAQPVLQQATPDSSPAADFTVSAGPAPAAPDGKPSIRVSPRAKGLATKKHIDIFQVTGTGPGGRIVEEDIRSFRQTAATSSPVTAVAAPDDSCTTAKNSSIRKAIAGNMHRSLSEMAQVTMHTTFDATEILAYRQKVKRAAKTDITLGDMVVFAVSRTILDFPVLNAHYSSEETKLFSSAHIGVAVDTPQGLLVPTVANANTLSLCAISQEIRSLASLARQGSLPPKKQTGATFTVTNLGTFGVMGFTPVINPPQTGILGVGAVEYKRKPVAGEMIDYPAMALSLTIDHRALDGAPAARFLQALVQSLEEFTLVLAE